ncbi:uncharacterized protein MELLADRAFT_77253 [Melampsora larici-populina 98AG31]|uniref:Uncharacterized protein n=1 Tax=Melampsora larici-populina (strain 98AG31 / pathotype 3-4-7) TaxID=747676 RepID=F4RFD3_MELLP|nr:uncharacterized protein MELLADRAFT_77253 [Melampsora larici-populina 98AG31]EGG08957.1 hypothetical protein MELLADRAFT_77253 [Melampsora larici-populina 98AG31]
MKQLGADHALIGPANEFKGEIMNTVGITGIGVVAKLSYVVEECCKNLRDKNEAEDPKTTVVTVEHTNYHPSIKPAPIFYVEYCVRPYKYLSGIPRILKLGREAIFHGYLKDYNEETRCYIVIANRVSTTSGHRDGTEFEHKAVKAEGVQNGSGRPKPKKFTPKPVTAPFKSPMIATEPANDPQPRPAEHPTASMSESASGSESEIALSKVPSKKKRPAVVAGNKRPRARPARRTSSSTTLDLTN